MWSAGDAADCYSDEYGDYYPCTVVAENGGVYDVDWGDGTTTEGVPRRTERTRPANRTRAPLQRWTLKIATKGRDP